MTVRRLAARLVPVSMVLAAVTCGLTPRSAASQAAPAIVNPSAAPTRVAVVNTQRIFNEMQETKVLKTKLADDQKKIEAAYQARTAALQKMQEDRNQNYKPGTPQYDDVNVAIMKETLDLKVFRELETNKLEFNYKKQLKALFDKVQSSVAEAAKREGYDMVLANPGDQVPDDLTQVNIQTLNMILFSKNVLFANEKNDLTSMVILLLDKKFKETGGTAAAGAK